MIADIKYQFSFTEYTDSSVLINGTWLVILHASGIPPHIGLMINGNYNSLTIKERELNISLNAVLKTIYQRKIETLFIKIVKHSVFSEEFLLSVFQEQLMKFEKVIQGEATCLSPIKVFFNEFYGIENKKEELFFDFVENLNENDYLSDTIGINIKPNSKKNIFIFKTYSCEQLENRIKEEREIYFKK